jgi:sulfoxide reductase heme-binding subunit YedZ
MFERRAGRLQAVIKALVFTAALLPFAGLLWGAAHGQLGANPAEYLIRATGEWTLRFLCLTLAITPLRLTLDWSSLARYRRMVGLFVYFYAFLHLLFYCGFDMGFELQDILKDIAKRPFILVGTLAFAMLTPLAATSFNRAIKFLGAQRWKKLHRLVYAVAYLAILHFFWMRSGKKDYAEVMVYGVVLGCLLLWRAHRRFMRPPSSRF